MITTKEALEPQLPERIAARICRCGVIALGTNACPHCGAGWAQVKVPLTTFYRVPAPIAPVVDNTGLHCNGCGLLIEGWSNVYRCVTRGCGRIYHYQCLLDHCASDHLCQNCKQSYKPYVLHCDKCGAEAFDCCLSEPCKQCGETFRKHAEEVTESGE